MSTHEARVVKLPEIRKHPDADKLGLVSIWDYTVVVALDSWKEGDLAVYIEPDTMVPVDRPEFSFLKKYEDRTQERIKVKKLRGIYSQGLLIPMSGDFKEGDDAWEFLDLTRYEPPLGNASSGGASEAGPGIIAPKYSLENYRKYGKRLFSEDDEIVISEKLHGTNSRFVFTEDRMWCGTRTRWIASAPEAQNVWWKALEENPWIKTFCELHPGWVLYGEVFGWVQDLRYGHDKGEVSFRVFDVLCKGENGPRWMDYLDVLTYKQNDSSNGLLLVPLLYCGPYSDEMVKKYTDGKTLIDMQGKKHIREGCVVKPVRERRDEHLGRVILKSVSDKYLEKAK